MRYLLLGFAAALVLGLASAPMARAFETQTDDSTNADGSPRFADPDEQLDAIADGGGGRSYIVKMADLDVGSGNSDTTDSDRPVHWTPEHIRLVFGPYAH